MPYDNFGDRVALRVRMLVRAVGDSGSLRVLGTGRNWMDAVDAEIDCGHNNYESELKQEEPLVRGDAQP
ncbi:hypothetical protein L1887_32141 [Cichorium endivia]|nr:hypothetical protein L1887_32141 [Cichorium endivia]